MGSRLLVQGPKGRGGGGGGEKRPEEGRVAEWGTSFGRWDTTLKLLPITTNQRNIQHRCMCAGM